MVVLESLISYEDCISFVPKSSLPFLDFYSKDNVKKKLERDFNKRLEPNDDCCCEDVILDDFEIATTVTSEFLIGLF